MTKRPAGDRTRPCRDADRTAGGNADPAELAKFSALAHRWWDPESEFKPLHDINPLRLAGSRTLPADSRASASSTSAAAAASSPKRWRIAARRSPASTCPKRRSVSRGCISIESGASVDYRLVAAEALAHEMPGRVRRRHVHGDARARAGAGVDRRGVRARLPSRAASSSSRRSTAIRSRMRRRSSAPNTCCGCCRAARTTGRASCGRPSSRGSAGARNSRSSR